MGRMAAAGAAAGHGLPRRLARLSVAVVVGLVAVAVPWSLLQFELRGGSEWAWAGAVQSSSASFRVRAADGEQRQFVVQQAAGAEQVVFQQQIRFSGAFDVASIDVNGLEPSTGYLYRLFNGSEKTWEGNFSTPTLEGTPMNFSVGFSGCSVTASQHKVFDDIKALNPFLMIHAGDLHYSDFSGDDVDKRIEVFDRILGGGGAASSLYTSRAFGYTWDDHDYCGNNRNSNCPGKQSARIAYQKSIPHYPLQALEENSSTTSQPRDAAIYQAFTIGTVRFVVTDSRTEAVKGGRMISLAQQAWLEQEFGEADQFDFIVWVNSRPWTGTPDENKDHWSAWADNRAEVSEIISRTIGKTKRNLIMLSSDSHMVAYDDGSHTDFSIDGDAGFPVLESGPLHNTGATLGNDYSGGCYTLQAEIVHQFSLVTFQVSSESGPCVKFTSYRRGADLIPIFSKELCGETMKPVGEAKFQGTCQTVPYVQDGTLVALIIAAGAFVLSSILCFLYLPAAKATEVVQVLLCCGMSLLFAGIILPLLQYLAIRSYYFEAQGVAFTGAATSLVSLGIIVLKLYKTKQSRKQACVGTDLTGLDARAQRN